MVHEERIETGNDTGDTSRNRVGHAVIERRSSEHVSRALRILAVSRAGRRKKTTTGNARSHAMNANKRTWGANLQKVRILVDGKPKRVWVSTRALRSGKVERV